MSHDGWVFVDLHWRMCPAQYPFRVDPTRLWSRAARVTLEGRQVRVFPVETLVGLLCLHGAKDTWHKLIWLCDLDRVIRVSPTLDWDEVRAFAEESRCRRAVGLVSPARAPPLRHALAHGGPGASRRGRDADAPAGQGRGRARDRRDPTPVVAGPLRRVAVPPRGLRLLARRCGLRGSGSGDPAGLGLGAAKVRLPDSLYGLYYLLRPLRLLATLPRDAFRRRSSSPGPSVGPESRAQPKSVRTTSAHVASRSAVSNPKQRTPRTTWSAASMPSAGWARGFRACV